MNAIEQIWRSLPLPDQREIFDWAGGTPPLHADAAVNFGNSEAFKGRFDVNNVPWNREIMRCFRASHVREITYIAPPQESGKTKTAEVCMAHTIVKKPRKMAFNTVTNVKAKGWHDTRWRQMMTATPAIDGKLSSDPDDTTKTRIVFADQTFFLIQGAETEGNRQGDSVEVQVNDECHLWERPWLSEMHTRTRAYRETRKILNISLGGKKKSELHEKFLEGNQLEWSHHCPSCTRPFQYVFDQKSKGCNIHFDLTKVVMRPDGGWDWTEFDKTVFVSCPHCKHRMEWSEELLAKMNAAGVYVARNPDANPEFVSAHVNAFAIGRRPWAEILRPWAKLYHRGGVFALEDLRKFICDDLAEFWEEKPIIVSKDLRLGSYKRADMLPGGIGWEKEWIRIMAVDNQHGSQGDIPHRWFVCRALARDGESRLVDAGRINEWSEVRARQKFLGVPDWTLERPGPWVVVDRRHNPTEVDAVCANFQWFGLMGHDVEFFAHGPESPHHGNQVLFSEGRRMDIGYGTAESGRRWAVYFLWSSHKVQDVFAVLRNGKGPKWEVPSDILDFCPEYAEQINSHRQVFETSAKDGATKRVWRKIGPDHIYDVECEIVVLGLMAGVFPIL